MKLLVFITIFLLTSFAFKVSANPAYKEPPRIIFHLEAEEAAYLDKLMHAALKDYKLYDYYMDGNFPVSTPHSNLNYLFKALNHQYTEEEYIDAYYFIIDLYPNEYEFGC